MFSTGMGQGGVCIYCSKSFNFTDKEHLSSSQSLLNRLFVLLGRHFKKKIRRRDRGILRFMQNMCSNSVTDIQNLFITSCVECKNLVVTVCEMYHEIKCLELKMIWRLETFRTVIRSGGRVPSRMKILKETCDKLDKDKDGPVPETFDRIKKFRRELIKKFSKLSLLPVVNLQDIHALRTRSPVPDHTNFIRDENASNVETTVETTSTCPRICEDQLSLLVVILLFYYSAGNCCPEESSISQEESQGETTAVNLPNRAEEARSQVLGDICESREVISDNDRGSASAAGMGTSRNSDSRAWDIHFAQPDLDLLSREVTSSDTGLEDPSSLSQEAHAGVPSSPGYSTFIQKSETLSVIQFVEDACNSDQSDVDHAPSPARSEDGGSPSPPPEESASLPIEMKVMHNEVDIEPNQVENDMIPPISETFGKGTRDENFEASPCVVASQVSENTAEVTTETEPQPIVRRLRSIHRCEVCRKTFSTSASLATHQETHSAADTDDKDSADQQQYDSDSTPSEGLDEDDNFNAEETDEESDYAGQTSENESLSSDLDNEEDTDKPTLISSPHDKEAERKTKADKTTSGSSEVLCRVCGGKSCGYNYGVLTCYGCQNFFRKYARKRATIKCSRGDGTCEINLETRSQCRFCRLKKCWSVGMVTATTTTGVRKSVKAELSSEDEDLCNNELPSKWLALKILNEEDAPTVQCFMSKPTEEVFQHRCPQESCTNQFATPRELEKHSRLHGEFKCYFCGLVKTYAPDLTLHEMKCLATTSQISAPFKPGVSFGSIREELTCHRKRKLYGSCPRCTWTTTKFSRNEYVAHHVETHLNMEMPENVRCPLCQRKFLLGDNIPIQSWKKPFRTHMLSNHLTSGLKCSEIFTCRVCSTLPKFRTKRQFANHKLEVHQAGGSQACDKPGCEGLNLPSLQHHRFHHDPNCFPFVCPKLGCAARFRHTKGLKRHMCRAHGTRKISQRKVGVRISEKSETGHLNQHFSNNINPNTRSSSKNGSVENVQSTDQQSNDNEDSQTKMISRNKKENGVSSASFTSSPWRKKVHFTRNPQILKFLQNEPSKSWLHLKICEGDDAPTVEKFLTSSTWQVLNHHCGEAHCFCHFATAGELEKHSKLHGEFKCAFCDELKTYAPDLVEHEIDCEGRPKIKCQEVKKPIKYETCPRCHWVNSHNWAGQLISHHLETHLNLEVPVRLICPLCRQRFLQGHTKACDKAGLIRHMLSNHDTSGLDLAEIFTCFICSTPVKFRSGLQLSVHKRDIHSCRFTCDESECAGITFPSPRMHAMERHSNNPEYLKLLRVECDYTGCLELFKSQADKERHRTRLHSSFNSGESRFSCDQCAQGYHFKYQLEIHKLTHSANTSTTTRFKFACPHKCENGKKMHGYEELQRHMKDLHNFILDDSNFDPSIIVKVTRFQCGIGSCPRQFLNENEADNHRKHHGNFECSSCKRNLQDAVELALHEESHCRMEGAIAGNSNTFSCFRCAIGTSFTRKQMYLRHFLEQHLQLPWATSICSICQKAYIRSSNLGARKTMEKHFKTFHNVSKMDPAKVQKCDQCPAFFKNFLQLRSHKVTIHGAQRGHVCPECKKNVPSGPALLQHVEKFHNHDQTKLIIACRDPTCSKMFLTEDIMELHAVIHNSPKASSEIKRTCSNCQREFRPSCLHRHRLVCGKNKTKKKYVCETCGKSFKHNVALNIHKLSHLGPDSWEFTCETCGKKCISKQKVDEHMRTHTQDKTFQCAYCGQKYAHRHNLRIHVNAKHGNTVQDVARKFNKTNLTSRKGIPLRPASGGSITRKRPRKAASKNCKRRNVKKRKVETSESSSECKDDELDISDDE